MPVVEVIEQNFNEFVAKEVVNALYYVSGLFTMVTSMCEYDEEADNVTRKEGEASKALITQKKEQAECEAPKGLFALSFEKIPCDLPIKSCQYRTGRRYIQPDNFPYDDGLDHYLGLMNTLSNQMVSLKTTDSQLSFDFATEQQLEFQFLCEEFVDLFPKLNDAMLQALKSYYPHQVDFLKSEEINQKLMEDYFTLPNGEQDFDTLEQMCFYVRALAFQGNDCATVNPEGSPSPQEYKTFLDCRSLDDLDRLVAVDDSILFDSC